MNSTRREEEEETILTHEILLRATMDYQETKVSNMQSRMGKDESQRGAGANCGRCKSRASKRSLEPAAAAAACALATNAPPPVTPMPTKPRHEEEEWRRRQEGKHCLRRHGFYHQPSFLHLSLFQCIFSSSSSTFQHSGSCQLVSKSLATAVQRARMVNVLSLRRDFKRFFQGT